MKKAHLRRCRASSSTATCSSPCIWVFLTSLYIDFSGPAIWLRNKETFFGEIKKISGLRGLKVNSQLLPAGFPRQFDAHVYFTEATLDQAQKLRERAKDSFEGKTFFVGEVIPEPIGPHPLPMFEMNFPKDLFGEVVLWLMEHRGELSSCFCSKASMPERSIPFLQFKRIIYIFFCRPR